ncbi:Protein C23G10.7 c [Aphelenchoides avenae]|nr:Protein C23G10.7 c [Aphelenchus avenae]
MRDPSYEEGSTSTTRFYIGNLAEVVDEQTLCQYCSDWGDLSEWKLMKEDDTGRSRGFAFVTFKNANAALRFQTAFPHYIGDRRVNVKPVQAPLQGVKVPYDSPLPRRLLVSHPLEEALSEELIQKYFSYFGDVKRVIRSFCQGMDCQGYTFVEFHDPRVVDACVECSDHMLDGVRLYVRRVVGVEDAMRFETANKAKRRREESLSLLSSVRPTKVAEYSSSSVSYHGADGRANSTITGQEGHNALKRMHDTLASAKISVNSIDEATFRKLLDHWWGSLHTINRRIYTTAVVPDDSEKKAEVCSRLGIPSSGAAVVRFIPRNAPHNFSEESYEVRMHSGKTSALFRSVELGEGRNAHVGHDYVFEFNADRSTFSIKVPSTADSDTYAWLRDRAFPWLVKWIELDAETREKCEQSNRLVGSEAYAETYKRLKSFWAPGLIEVWKEKTDPRKMVFEDCGIASYLLEYWKHSPTPPKMFADIGCGNGVLTYLLTKEGFAGVGLDIRKRKIWDQLSNVAALREQSIDPSSPELACIPKGVDCLIGNHSDEMTPWIPVMAARLKCSFFLLPCCPHDFFEKFCKRHLRKDEGRAEVSVYEQYRSYVRHIIGTLGFEFQEDRLKIPSPKRMCFVAHVPANGLPEDVEDRIAALLQKSQRNKRAFTVRRSEDVGVRNCSQLPRKVQTAIVTKVVDRLLATTDMDGSWRRGTAAHFGDLIGLITPEEANHLRAQNGGLQTLLKNHHQVFVIREGRVQLRDWPVENEAFLKKTNGRQHNRGCWFFENHPDGCRSPLRPAHSDMSERSHRG